MNNELERTWKEMVTASFKVLSCQLPARVDDKHTAPQSEQLVSWPRLQPSTTHIQARSITALRYLHIPNMISSISCPSSAFTFIHCRYKCIICITNIAWPIYKEIYVLVIHHISTHSAKPQEILCSCDSSYFNTKCKAPRNFVLVIHHISTQSAKPVARNAAICSDAQRLGFYQIELPVIICNIFLIHIYSCPI
jgi:hypothetical protein